MTKEDKQLLLKDICARVPYGVYVKVYEPKTEHYLNNRVTEGILGGYLKDNMCEDYSMDDIYEFIDEGDIVKPYLRSMSSMTDDERTEFRVLGGVMSYSPQHGTWAISAFSPESYDWLNKKAFDYRGLIPMGIAIEATKGMYKVE